MNGSGAMVHPVRRLDTQQEPQHPAASVENATNAADVSTNAAGDPVTECFICAKPVRPTTRVTQVTVGKLACNCLAHNALHQACFDEWYNKEGTCPFCRSACAETDAIRLHIRETLEAVQQENDEVAQRQNRRTLLLSAMGVCLILCAFAFLLVRRGGTTNDHDGDGDDDWYHTHDDDTSVPHRHAEETMVGI